jgi:uncharacterized RDD family membrane protein YckC
MTATDDYVSRVLSFLPRATPERETIALELRSHIAERLANGQPVDAVLHQLGDPARLAESYLSAVPMEPATFFPRAGAKLIDFALVVAIVVPTMVLSWYAMPDVVVPWALLASIVAGSLGFCVYTMTAEYWMGQTLGKRIAGLHVVRESGAPIGLGQAFVRLLPVAFQFYWVDVMFALFTERHQRAFELLSKTRVVKTTRPPARA